MVEIEPALGVVDALDRRRFLDLASRGAASIGGLSLLSACGGGTSQVASPPVLPATPMPSATPGSTLSTGISSTDVLNFSLNIGYLESQFFSFAATGTGTSSGIRRAAFSPRPRKGSGKPSTLVRGRAVSFTDPNVGAFALELANAANAQATYLRTLLSSSAVAIPSINIDGGATGPFATLAQVAGIVTPTGSFDPYASDENFLLGAFFFADLSVTADLGALPLITDPSYFPAALGLLAAKSYFAGLIRTLIYRKGINNPSSMLIQNAGKISALRASLDGTNSDDQGVAGVASPDGGLTSNIIPADSNAIAFSRTARQVLNILYGAVGVNAGLFFPTGVNGAINH